MVGERINRLRRDIAWWRSCLSDDRLDCDVVGILGGWRVWDMVGMWGWSGVDGRVRRGIYSEVCLKEY